jgi:hypothetical protein
MEPKDLYTPTATDLVNGAKAGASMSDILFVVACSVKTAEESLHPWMATTLADIPGLVQTNIDNVRAVVTEVAVYCHQDSVVEKDAILAVIEKELLGGPEGAQWQTCIAHKPSLKHVVRMLVEIDQLSRKLVTLASTAAMEEAPIMTAAYWNLLNVAEIRRQLDTPTRLPFTWIIPPVGWNKVYMGTMPHFAVPTSVDYGMNVPWPGFEKPAMVHHVPEVPVEAAQLDVKPTKPTKKDAEAVKAETISKLTESIKAMVASEVKKAVSQDSVLLSNLVNQALSTNANVAAQFAKHIASSTGTSMMAHIQLAAKQVVAEKIAAVDTNLLMQQQLAQMASTFTPEKMQKEIADKIVAQSDDYFTTIFNRIVVVALDETGKTGSIIGRLSLKNPLKTSAIPTLPKKEVKATTEEL